jgi:CSLREA domain-containing protein
MLDREQFRIPVRLAVAALLATGLTLAPTMARAASDDGVFIVTSTGDGGDATTVSNCAAGAGECTLRGAILAANAHPNLAAGPDAITFSIPGPQPHTIAPTSALPVLTDTVTVDAGLPATPWAPRSVELTGRACNPGGILCDGLVVDAPDTTIRGFAIHEFFAGVRNLFGQGDGLVVEGNFIGTEPTGSLPAQRPFVPTSNGVLLDHISRARIGGDPGVGRGNLIAGHAFAEVNGIFATQLQVLGNRLGIAADGTTSLGAGWDVRLESSPDSRVGTAASPNVMAGPVTASGAAVELVNTPGTSVQGNLIGVDASGSVRTGVGGISVQSDHVLVGGAGQGNVISGGIGVRLQSNPATRQSGGNVVSHNLIGTDVAGLVAIPNGVGVTLSDSGSTVEDNLISGNTGDGIAMLK